MRIVEDLRRDFGEPFPPLPDELVCGFKRSVSVTVPRTDAHDTHADAAPASGSGDDADGNSTDASSELTYDAQNDVDDAPDPAIDDELRSRIPITRAQVFEISRRGRDSNPRYPCGYT